MELTIKEGFSRDLIKLIKHIYFIYAGGLWGVWILVVSKAFSSNEGDVLAAMGETFSYVFEFVAGFFGAFASSTIFLVAFLLVSLNRTIDPLILTITSSAFFLMFMSSTTWLAPLGLQSNTYIFLLLVAMALLLNMILFKKKEQPKRPLTKLFDKILPWRRTRAS